jgi:hypothetical protein
MFDDSLHPDLVDLDGRIRLRLEAVLQAEQESAAVFVRRSAGLRDRLLELEEGAHQVEVLTPVSHHRGTLVAVGKDHLEISAPEGAALIAFKRVVAVSWR